MSKFAAIRQRAEQRKGGAGVLQGLLARPASRRKLLSTSDDRWLAQMARCVFQAGFVWRVVDQKWDGFETVFHGFAPDKLVLMSPEQLDQLAQDARIIRNRQKIDSVIGNAQFVLDIAAEHGSFARFAVDWPDQDLVGLFTVLRKQGFRLGGMTGQRVLRNLGRDSFILTADVLACLKAAGVDVRNGSTARELGDIQAQFNVWKEESGLSFTEISRTCAYSVGENIPVEKLVGR